MAVRGENSLFFESGINTNGLKSGISEATGLVQGLAGTIGRINPFAALATGAVAAFTTIANEAYQLAKDFDKAMKEVETISEAAQNDFKGISNQVFELSKISPDGPVKLAQAYYQIVSAGYDGAEGLKLLEVAAKAATAGVTTTETAADGITTVLNAFKLGAEDAEDVADALFQTVKLGKTNFEQLSSSLSQVAPLAAASGFEFREVLAAVASLTKQGTPTAQAMTQIRAAIEATTKVLGDGASETLTLQNAFQAVYKEAGGSQNKLKELTGSVEAMGAILSTTGENAKGAAQDLEDLGNSAGASQEAFERNITSNTNQLTILQNKLKATTKGIGDAVLDMSNRLAGFLNDTLSSGKELEKSFQDQRVELSKLKGELLSATEGSEEFNRIRNEIVKNYPEFIGGIDSETASTKQLLNVINQVNDAYIQRYKFAQRQEDLEKALREQGDLEIKIDDYKDKFEQTLARLDVIAKDNGVQLQIDYNQSDSEILKSVKQQLEGVQGAFDRTLNSGDKSKDVLKGFAQGYLNSLSQSIIQQNQLNSELKEQSNIVDGLLSKNKRLSQADLKTKEGQSEAIRQINQALKESDLSTFQGSGISIIDQTIAARLKVIDQFRTIDNTDVRANLKPYLNSELEEVKAYAQKRDRILNTDYTPKGGSGGDSKKDAFTEVLNKNKEEYRKYEAVVAQIGKEIADTQFETLIEQGADYGEYLKNLLEKTKSFAEQQKIALAAESEGINLNREVAKPISTLQPITVPVAVEIDKTSIDSIDRKLKNLYKEFRAAKTESERQSLAERISATEKELSVAEQSLDKEKELYEDVFRALDSLTNQQLKDYVAYWRGRLDEAEKGSKEQIEIEGKISAAQRAIWQKRIQDIKQQLESTAEIFRDLGQDNFADLLNGLSNVATQVDNVFKILDENTSKEDKISAGISAAIDLTGMLVSASANRKKAEEDFYNSVIRQQKEYNRLLNDQVRTQASANENVFTEDYINQIEKGITALTDANSRYEESIGALGAGKVKIGQRNAVDINNVLKGAGSGAVLGAAIGSVVPLIGNAVGAVVGGVVGAVAGLFGGKKKKDEYTSLLQEYPELITTAADGQKSFNVELGKTLLEQNLVNDATKILIEETISWQEQIDKAKEQIAEVVDVLAGDLGSSLRDSLVKSFEEGGDAAKAMGDTISDVLENIVEQLIFDQIFSAQFKKLQEEMQKSFDIGGDDSFTDDFARFFEASKGLTDDFNRALRDAQSEAENFGFDILNGDGSRAQGLSGAIASVTEDTANILAGHLNAMRLDQRNMLEVTRQSNIHLSEISVNTRYNRHLERLESIDGRFASIESAILQFQAGG